MRGPILPVTGARGDELAAVFDPAVRNLPDVNTVRYNSAVYNRTVRQIEENRFA